MREFDNPSSATNSLVGKGFVMAVLTQWTLGNQIWAGGRFLKKLGPPPPEIWELRVTDPAAQARLFGRFAEPDTLVLTNFHTRGYLGKMGSANWNDAMKQCELQWKQLFQDFEPFSASLMSEYVTENCHDFKI